MQFLRCQVKNGSNLILIYNEHENEDEEKKRERINEIKSAFQEFEELGRVEIVELNIKNALQYIFKEKKNHNQEIEKQEIKQESANTIRRKKMLKQKKKKEKESLLNLIKDITKKINLQLKGTILYYTKLLYHLLNTNYLIITRLISSKMQYDMNKLNLTSALGAGTGLSNFGGSISPEIKNKIADLKKQVDSLIKSADSKILNYKKQIKIDYFNFITKITPSLEILAQDYQLEVPEGDLGASSLSTSIINVLSTPTPTHSETKLKEALIQLFITKFSNVCLFQGSSSKVIFTLSNM